MSAHTASQIVSIVSVRAADQPVATVALAVVSDALKSPAASSSRRQAHCYRLDAAAHRTRSPGGSCPKPEPPRDGLRPQLNQLAGYAGEYDFASQAFASWHFRWCRRERRGARRQEMYGSRQPLRRLERPRRRPWPQRNHSLLAGSPGRVRLQSISLPTVGVPAVGPVRSVGYGRGSTIRTRAFRRRSQPCLRDCSRRQESSRPPTRWLTTSLRRLALSISAS